MELGIYTNRLSSNWNPYLYSKADAMDKRWTERISGGKSRRNKRKYRKTYRKFKR